MAFVDLEMSWQNTRLKGQGKQSIARREEFALLEYFLRHKNKVVTRTEIAEHVWETNFDSESNVIDVYVSFLRKKIDLACRNCSIPSWAWAIYSKKIPTRTNKCSR